jgi:ferredoxin
MTFVVTTNCEGCRFTDCALVCPVDAFHGDAEMLYIDPEQCIDCGVCLPVCPVGAIFADIDLPTEQQRWLDINRERAVHLPIVNSREPEPEGARELARARGFPVI